MKTVTRLLQVPIMILIISSAVWAQTPASYNCSLRNDSLVNSTTYEFDIYLQNTDLVNVFELALFQAGIVVNPAIYNAGTVTATIVAGSSGLNAAEAPTTISFTQAQNCIKLAPRTPPGHLSGTIIPTTAPGVRVCRIRLTNTVAFAQASLNPVFNFSASPYNTIVSAYDQTTGLNITITNAANHTVTPLNNPVFNAPVTAFNVTGTGVYCSGPGLPVGLDGSEIGVDYKLLLSAVQVGPAIPGTGAAVTFGNQTAGTYTSSGWRKGTYLTTAMNGSAVITTSTPSVVSVTIAASANPVCTGASVTFTATPVNGGTSPVFQWSVNNISVGTNNPTLTYTPANNDAVACVLTSNAPCSTGSPATSNTITMVVNPLPVPTISGQAAPCAGATGNVYTTEAGMTNYTWTVSAGGTITAGGTSTSNTVTITWNTSGAQSVSVNYTNANNCTAAVATNYPVNVTNFITPTLSGLNSVCIGQTGVVYTTETGQTNYVWTVSAGGTITGGGTSTSNTVTVTWNGAGAQTVSVSYTNGTCTALTPTVYNVTVINTVGTPTAITVSAGVEPTCQLTNGTTTTTYATTATDNTGFNWSLSNPAAGSINATTGVMTWANGFSGSVNIQVTANGCNGPSVQVTRTVNITPTVGTPTVITVSAGTEPTCQLTNGTTTTTYATTASNSTGFNWSLSNPAAGSINATTGVMTWANGFQGNVNIQVTANGCNGPSSQVIRTVTVTPTVGTPTAITVSAGAEPTCQLTNGTTTTTYATTATNNTGFNWSLSNPAAGSINATTGVMTWANGFSGSVNIQVTANGCNGPSAQVTRTVNITPTVGTPTAITVSAGTEPTCQLTNGTTTTTYATTATNNTGFNWSLSNPAAGSINAISGVMTWANGFSGSVNIQVTANGCNGPSAQVTRTVNITPTVGTPTAITVSAGTEPTCQLTNGTTSTTYATTATDNTGFNWSLSNPAAGSINATSGLMTWANGFSGSVNIQVTANGCNGPSAQVTRTVNITPTVGTPTAITVSAGTEPTCQLTNGTTTTTYATTATNSTGFNWSISTLAAGSINATTGVMTWANGFVGSVDIQVTANGCNGPSAQVIRTVNVTTTVGTPTAITVSAGTEPTCQLTNGTTTTTYATTATNSTGFNWSLSNPSAGSINATTGVMTWANGFSGNVNIQVTANGCNGPSAQVIRTVSITPTVGTPTAITVSAGTEPTCQLTNGTTTTTYATTATNSTGFNWSLSNPTAGSINATTGVMTWANGFLGSVNIQVTANGCNGPSAQTIRTVNVTTTVGTPTAITVSSGTEPTCQLTNGTTTTTYTTTATNSTGFNWSLNNPAAGSINATTGVMTWANGFSGSVNIQVTANGCNGPSAQVTRTVNITPTVGTPTAITVSAGTEPTCQLTNGTTTTTYATTATNNTGFNWSLSSPAAGSINASTGVMTWANGFSGSVNIQVTANGCNGPSAQVTRTVNITPTVGTPTAITVSAGTEPTCQLTNGTTTTTYATTATNSTGFNWSISNPSAGSINATTGVMTWANGFLGSVNIQVTANGCNGPSAQTIRTVNVTSTVGTPTAITVSAGTEPTCQLTNGTTTTTYATTATNSTGFNWSISNALAGVINPTTGVITWADAFFGSVDIQVTANGCNGPSAQVIRTVVITAQAGTPTPITISAGTEPTCQLTNGTTTTTYTTTATNATSFNWSISNPAAGSINSLTRVMTWANGFSGTVDIQVTAVGCNGLTPMTVRTVTITPTVGTPTAITVSAGTDPSCQLTNGTTTTTYSTTASNSTGFNWSLSNPAAGSINATTGVMTWANGFSGSVDIQVTANGCNGPSAQVIHTVNVTPTVGTPTAIIVSAGTEPTCELTNGSTTTTYSTTATNSTGFNWSLSNPAAGIINASTGVMTWANLFSGSVNIQVTANGCNGPSSQVIRTVVVTPTVGTPTAITISAGTEPICQLTNATTTTTYATTATNSTGFTWSITNLAAGSIDATTGVMTWANGFSGSVDIHVTANGCNGPSAHAIRTVTVNPIPVPTITGQSAVCTLATGVVYTTEAAMTNYVWAVSAGGTITGGGTSTSNTVTVSWNTMGSQSVSVSYTNGSCTAATPTVFPVTVGTSLTPTITGNNLPCVGATGVVYTTEASMTGYTWTISAGGTITAGAGTNAITVTWNTAGAQSVSVNYTSGLCSSTGPTTYPVTVLNTVGTPTAITISAGTEPTCELTIGAMTTTYSTTATDNTGFNWSISNALAGSINASTGVMTWALGFSGSVNIQVTANGCSGPSAQVIRTVNVTPTVGTPTAITISAGTEPTCQLTNGTTTTTYATTATNSTGFNWTLTNVLAGSIDPLTGVMTWANGFSGSVDIHVTANGCNGPSAHSIRTVTIALTVGSPTAITVSAGSEPSCQLTNGTTTTTYATTATNNTGFNWSISNPAAGSINATTGVMTWANGFSGSVNIQVTANGCNGPSPQSIRSVIITPTVGTPTVITVSAGTEPTCQLTNGTTTTMYATTATNNTGLLWSISNLLAGSINSATGVMTWANGFSGSVDIQVIANGCNGPSLQVIRTVTVVPTVGTPTAITVSAGTEPSCQLTNGTTTTTYATTATDNTGFTWSTTNPSAGSIDPSTGVMTWANGFFGSVDIHVTANGCNGPSAHAIRTVTIAPTVGTPTAVTVSAGTEPTCQLTNGTTTTTYATTATNSTGFNWSVSNPSAGTINATTGVMTWANGFSGNVNIQVTANGCNGPSAQVIRSVTVTPTVGTPTAITVSAGTEPTCQLTNGTTTTTYSTTAINNTGFNWSISNPAAGSINATTGVMTWANGFLGTVNIQVTANGCNGPSSQVIRTVNVTVTVGTPTAITISAGSEPTCQLTNGTTTTTYSTTATNSTGFNWSLSNPAAGSINASTGVMTWANGFSGSVNIIVTANGCNGPSAQVIRTVSITPTVGTPTAITVSAGVEPSCQLTNGTTTTTYATTATNNTGFNWSLSNPAAGSINATTGVMTWANGFSGSVNIQVTANGCNGPSSQVIRTVSITPTVGTPTAITVSAGVEPTCQLTNGTTTTTYATTATNSTSFNWSISNPAAGSINATTGVMTWANGFSGTVNIQVTANGCNGPSAQVIRTVNNTTTVGTPTAITVSAGVEPTCQLTNGTTTTTYATTATGSTSFNWSISNPAAGSINGTTGVMTWANGFTGSVNIQVTANGCNGPSAQVIRTVIVGPTVETPTTITVSAGTEPTCQLTNGTTTTTYAATATNNTGFNWSVSNPSAGTINATTGVMTWANGFSGSVNIQVTANGCNGPSAQVIHSVNITPTVGTPTAITVSAGTEPTCQLTNGTTTTTYATTATNNTGFNWSISNPAAGSINATTGVMTWANGFIGNVNIQVTANGCNGPSAQVTRTVSISVTVGTPTAITVSAGVEPTCQLTNGTTTTTYASTATNNTGFNWSISNPSAGTINATTGVMTWANGFAGSVNILVTANGCNGPSAQVIRSVSITPTVGTPTAITVAAGTEPTCQLLNGTTTTTYATTATNNTGFNWSISNPAAGSINASTGVMTWANGFSGSVDIQVTANGCNGPSIQVIRTVSNASSVGTPTAITVSAGTEPTCQLTNGTTTTTYATTATNNTGFNWSISNPAAGSINASTGVMTWANGFSGSVNIQVTANGCNGPSAQVIRSVNIAPAVGTPTAITVSAGTEPTCQLTNGTTTTTYATTATNNTGFNWSISSLTAGSINATTGVMTWANGFSGSVDIQVTANGCNGPSLQVIRTVTIAPTVGTPTAITIAAGTEPTCQVTNGTTITTYATTATNNTGFNWSISNPTAGSINATTGVMTWANGFGGSVDIQVTADGCNGPSAQVIRSINLGMAVGTPTAITVSAGVEPICQLTNGTTTTTYATTATNNTGFNWSLSNPGAGSINATTGVMTWANGFAGTVNIQVTANGCNGPSLQVNRTVNITPSVGTPTAITVSAGVEPTCQLMNGTTTTTYHTTATNNTGFNWSINNPAAGSINAATGVMTWANGFSGSVNIRVTANGCNGPSAQVIRTVNVAPAVGTPTAITVSAGVEPNCQITDWVTTTTYATTAGNSTSFNWTISNPFAGIINANTGVMSWTNGFEGSVNIEVTANGCDGPSAQVVRTVNITPSVGTPTAITISAGADPVCQLTNGTTTTAYATTAANSTGFNWSLSNPAAGSINATTGVMTWADGFSGSVDIQVTANGCNGPSAQVIHTVDITPTVGTPTPITDVYSTEPACQLMNGTTTTTYATTATNSTGFNWSISNPAAGSIDATTGVMTWANGFEGLVDIQVTANGCNGPSVQVIRSVHVQAMVGTPTAITVSGGTEPDCQLTNGTTTTTYATTATHSTGFNWSISNPAAGSIDASTGVMTWSDGFAGSVNIMVSANGCDGPSSQVTRTVTITPTVGTPTAITVAIGPEPTCQLTLAGTTTKYATTATNSTGFNWSTSNPAAGSINASTGVMTWAFGFAGTVNIEVTADGCNGPSSQVIRTINITPSVGTPTPITVTAGTEPSCQLTNGTTTTTYSTTSTNSTGFNWSISNPAAGSINATTGVMTWTNNFSGSVNIRVTANGCNGPSAQVIRPVTVTPTVGTPTAITISAGTQPTCQLTNGTTTTTYATTANNNTGFNWSISNPAAGSINATTGVMTWADGFAGSVIIRVTANGCNGPSAQVTRTVNITPTVGTPTAITISAGTEPICQLTNGTTTTTYGSTATNSTGLNWSISTLAAGSINATTGVMTWANGFAGTVNIQVTANGCNGPSAQVIRTVNVTPTVGTPTAITVSAGVEPTCQLTSGITTTTYATTASSSTSFNWSVSNPAAGSINATTGVMTWTNGFVGTVLIQVTANGCNGPSVMVTRSVTINPLPMPSITGPQTACAETPGYVYTTQPGMSYYLWVVSGGGVITSGGTSTSNTATITWNTPGTQSLIVGYINSNGCASQVMPVYQVNVNPAPVPTISGSSSVCTGATNVTYSTESGMTGYTWTISAGGTIVTGAGTNSVTVNWSTIGAQSIAVNYVNNNGCTAASQTSKVVTVNPLPVPTITGVSEVCAGTTGVNYSTESGMTGYTWTVSTGGVITAGTGTNSITVTWNTAGARSVSVNYTNENNCVGSAPTVYNVTVDPLPVPVITGLSSVCIGATAVIYSTDPGMTGYTWAISPGGTIDDGDGTDTISVTWNTAGDQTVSVNYTNADGCTAASPTTKSVTVNPLPVPTITGQSSVCVGATNVNYSTQSGMTGYVWTISAGGTITAGSGTNSITVSWNTTGAQSLSVLYTNANGCTAAAPAIKNVTINPLPLPTITGVTSACAGTTGVTYTTESGMTGYTWVVSAGGTLTAGSGTNSVTVTWNTAGAQTVSVNYTNGNGCTAVSPTVRNVTVNPLPVPTITGLSAVCSGTTGVSYTTESGMTGYTWTISSGGIITAGSTTNSITVSWNTPGAQFVTVNYTNSNGCTATTATTKNVTVNSHPVPVITGNSSICSGTSGIVYTTQAGMSNYLWTVSAGGIITAGGTSTSNTVTITWNTPGNQSVSVSYTNENGCNTLTPTNYPVTVYPLPVPTIAGLTSVCVGASGVVYTTQSGMSEYNWIVSAGGVITSGGTSESNTVTVTWTTVGQGSVNVSYTDQNGCSADEAVTYLVTINPLPNPSITGLMAVCQGSTGLVYTTETGMTDYNWAISDGGMITTGSGTNAITVTWTTAGSQSVSVNYADVNGCVATLPTEFDVMVNPLPVPAISGLTSVCVGASGVIYTTEPGMTEYTWSVSAGGTIMGGSGTNSITVDWNTPGAQAVSVNYVNENGCEAAEMTVYPVTVNPLSVPTIGGLSSVCAGSENVTYTTEPGMTNYLWSVSAGGTITSGTGTNTITVNWNTTGPQTVSVTYTNEAGCVTTEPTVFDVSVHSLPVPVISGLTAVCVGSTGVIYTTEPGMTGYNWMVSAGGIITSGTGTNSITVNWNSAGPQSISVNYINVNGCGANVPTLYNVMVNDLPVPAITGLTSVCVGTSGVTYSTDPGMTGYSWTVSAGGIISSGSGTNTITVDWNTPGPQTVSASYINANGCASLTPTAYSVFVNTLPTPSITGQNSLCVGSTNVMYTTESGMTGYNWNIVSGGTITSGSGTNIVMVSWNTPGIHSITVNYTNGNGCTAPTPSVYNVTVNPGQVPTITGPTSMCVFTAGNVYTTEPGMTGYLWTVSPGGIITAGAGTNSITVTWNAAGTQNVGVIYTVTNGCSPVIPTNYSVFVNSLPEPGLTGPSNVCALSTGNVYTTDLGMIGYTWMVSFGGVITAGAGTNAVTVTWNTPGPQFVSVSYNTSFGCSPISPTVKNVFVNPVATPTISGPANVCVNSSGNVYTTQAGMSAYTWTISSGGTITAGGTPTSNTVTVTWNTSGNQTVSVNYSGSCGISTPAVYNVTVNPLPVPTISGPSTVCVSSAGNIYTTQPGMSGYVWSVSAGGLITSGAGTDAITVTWNGVGAQNVSVSYTGVNGCSSGSPAVYSVIVNPLPVPVIFGPATACALSSGNVYTTDFGMTAYVWTVSGGGVITAGAGTNSITVTWNSVGTQFVSVTYVTPTGCMPVTPSVKEVIVNPITTPTLTGPASVCVNSSGNVYTTEPGMAGYTWTVSPGGIITAGGTSSSNTVTVAWNSVGAQSVSINYIGICNALVPTTYNVTVNPLPIPTISGMSSICTGSSGVVYTTEAGMNNYVWSISEGGTIIAGDGTNTVTVVWNEPGNHIVSIMYTNENGCTGHSTSVINVHTIPDVALAQFSDVCQGTDPFLLTGGTPMGGVYSGPFVSNGYFNPSTLGTFEITYTYTENGCTGSAVNTITVISCAPNTISGTITYDNDAHTPMSFISVYLNNSTQVTTDANGYYEFSVPGPGDYTVSASCNKPWGGGNSADALLILKHFVGISYLTGLRMQAADINGDHFINSIDALSVARRFVELINSFPVGDWTFEVNTVTVTNENVVNDFKALCVGDVNGSHTPAYLKIPATIDLSISGIKEIKPYASFDLPIKVVGKQKVGAVSLILNYPENLLDVLGVIVNSNSGNVLYTADHGQLKISWYAIREMNLDDQDILLTIQLKSKNISGVSPGELSLSLDGTSEIADRNAITLQHVNLTYPKLVVAINEFTVSNYPNPFKEMTAIVYTLPEAGKVNLKVYNVLGDVVAVLVDNVEQEANTYKVTFDGSALIPGIYTYRMELSGQSLVHVKSGMMVISR